MRTLLVASLVIALSSCGAPTSTPPGQSAPRPSEPVATGDADRELYETNATVLASEEHGPMLCLGGIMTSLPPQCGNVPVEGWDWDRVEGEERAGGTTWGGPYHVVGGFDGEVFTLAEAPGPPAARLEPADGFSSEPACPEPPGGWVTDGEGIDQEAAGRVLSSIDADPDYAAGWVTQLAPPGDETDTGPVVLNAAFTKDVAEHRAELDERWPGSLCVTEYELTFRELRRIQQEAGEMAQELGSANLWSDVDVTRNVVELHLVHLPDETRAKLEARFGREALRLSAALVPVAR